ncbi:MAG TPA: outer membrane beta-barrel protein [Verrucomicrobiae bacterium]|nr:outer membrane beta-barrel protein [Verrucomicrobiae bacterium]
MRMNDARFHGKVIGLAALWFFAATGVALAQGAKNSAGAGVPTAPNAPEHAGAEAKTAAPTTAEILEELERMRARIAVLEAELKAQAGNENAVASAKASQPQAAVAEGSTNASAGAGPESSNAATGSAGTLPPAVSSAHIQETSAATPVEKPAKAEPFAFADFSWLNGNSREKDTPLDTKLFTPEFRSDVVYIYDFNHPADDTIGGSSEVFRSQEVQLTQLGIGGDFHYNNVRGRVMTQFGEYSETTPRNDASYTRGQWNLNDAYRYLSEAYGGYHWDVMHGVNLDAGIFLSYIGLFSYYNYDNWAYQPSYVSSNTPWFFNGVRLQVFPTEHLKIEPWFINGWQSYGRFNNKPGLGGQILWRPNGWFELVANQYGLGQDDLGVKGRSRIHTDDSIEVKYYDNPDRSLDKMAFSLTADAGCEYGAGVSCHGTTHKGPGETPWPKQSFLGFMLYNRYWFDRDKFGLTLGGGRINNPGRYLVLLPPINGATAASGTPYFTENPGDPYKAWDSTATFDYMPSQYITFRWEFDHRAASVPYFSGPGGITPPASLCPTPVIGNNICGSPGAVVPGWAPDLVKIENRINMALLVKF